jgi:hypothetical protein
LNFDPFWSPKLGVSREGTDWSNLLQVWVIYRLVAPGNEWRLHRQWHDQSAMKDLKTVWALDPFTIKSNRGSTRIFSSASNSPRQNSSRPDPIADKQGLESTSSRLKVLIDQKPRICGAFPGSTPPEIWWPGVMRVRPPGYPSRRAA